MHRFLLYLLTINIWTVFVYLEDILDWSVTALRSNAILQIIYLLLNPYFWASTLTAWIRVNCYLSSEPETAADNKNTMNVYFHTSLQEEKTQVYLKF